ncbi:hypothetical protein BDZ97DRAFT_1754817 [Flammula alnicola]|nr:hypothetical protein BDZ97DRAFT_1754817 [Flammula alnicola]
MQYGHMPLQDRRDPNLDGNGSTSFHQNGLGQALGGHLAGGVGPGPAYNRGTEYRPASHSPPTTIAQPGTSGHAAASSSHSPLTFTVQGQATSPAMKRKQVDNNMNAQALKRRRETGGGDEGDSYDMDGGAQGAKHWTDDEKSRLFNWLMGPGQEDHWNALRATKNSCLRECAIEVFGGKKTYQALKGCYERNFNLFKQIYAFETAHGQPNSGNLGALSEADRLREYERRLSIVRKTTDVGSITARTIDHWHRVGWYDLFYRRWHGDPATTRPVQVQARNSIVGNNSMGGGDDAEDDDNTMDFHDPSAMNGLHGMSHDRGAQVTYTINPQDLRDNPPPQPPPIPPTPSAAGLRQGPQPQASIPATADAPLLNLAMTQDLVAKCIFYLNLQTQVAQEKLEYLKRRESREQKEFAARKEMEKRSKSEKAFVRFFSLEMFFNANDERGPTTNFYRS